MSKKYLHIISSVAPGSIGQEMDLEPGDAVYMVNGQVMEDIFDYQYLINDENIVLSVIKENGEEWELEIEKDYDEDLGLTFESSLMDNYRSCANKCIFCFIDQLPPGMRETMYFKDDDSRLSFLQGNYITLTNMKDKDLDRIIKYRLEPINISVHTTEPDLRCMMLHNRFAGKLLDQLQKLYDGRIEMNAQIVLCKNINDKEHLDRTIEDLSRFMPYLEGVSVVPMGFTKYREGLYPVEPFNSEDAKAVLDQIQGWQQRLLEEYDNRFVYAGDEWYIMAGRPIPPEEEYDGYGQLENGIGMMRLLMEEFEAELSRHKGDGRSRHVSVVSGVLASGYIRQLLDELQEKYPNVRVDVHCVVNHFFGESITVTGLITGQDIVAQLSGKDLGEVLLLPCNMLRSGENVLLDDMTTGDIEKALQVPVDIIKSNGDDLIIKVLGE
ncbi:putative radical SAM enzyme (TIGR03279 family) [Catenibacillus scindens]|uniref:Putative radical SAM enzyme (TIGR03279 family) n=1 Tax=Catenibacillus scindens TaxID=673271 RepID=A0A7W8HBM0_9FIRM|nr:DUF512 domain-containing protein [Catenibacillus scindens]MBB5265486.1 putative radical SAM enzyme (TIGR03279 family) [Catenibacillus scindens]